MPRSVMIGAAVVLLATPVLIGIGDAAPPDAPAAQRDNGDGVRTVTDTAQVRTFLGGMRGANALQCELGLQTLDLRFGWRRVEVIPDGPLDTKALVQWASGRIDDPATVPLLRAAVEDLDPCVRRVAARLLGRMRGPEAVSALLEALRHPDPATRELGALGLGFAEDRQTVRPLVDALDDANAPVRAMAAWALGHLESRDAVAALTRVLRADTDASVRRTAAWALGAMY